jgi:hypothetical protein
MLINEVRGISAPTSVVITSQEGGDQIELRDEDGNPRYIFRGLKTYRVIDGKEVLWDMESGRPASRKERI